MRVKSLERKIANLEGFAITICYADGRDIRGDKANMPGYPYELAARNDFTVAQWRDQRFLKCYPGLSVKVWLADGEEAHPANKLATVRDTYLEE